jgi:hypothetical protein
MKSSNENTNKKVSHAPCMHLLSEAFHHRPSIIFATKIKRVSGCCRLHRWKKKSNENMTSLSSQTHRDMDFVYFFHTSLCKQRKSEEK